MKRLVFLLLPAGLLLILCGCAGTTFRRIANEKENEKDKGIRYVESSTYLLVTTDNKGGIKSEILQLPDRSRLYSARPWSFMASNNTTLTMKDGGLSGSQANIDATKVPAAVLSAAAGVIAGLNSDQSGSTDGAARLPGPRLYKLMPTGPKGTDVAFVESRPLGRDILYKP